MYCRLVDVAPSPTICTLLMPAAFSAAGSPTARASTLTVTHLTEGCARRYETIRVGTSLPSAVTGMSTESLVHEEQFCLRNDVYAAPCVSRIENAGKLKYTVWALPFDWVMIQAAISWPMIAVCDGTSIS